MFIWSSFSIVHSGQRMEMAQSIVYRPDAVQSLPPIQLCFLIIEIYTKCLTAPSALHPVSTEKNLGKNHWLVRMILSSDGLVYGSVAALDGYAKFGTRGAIFLISSGWITTLFHLCRYVIKLWLNHILLYSHLTHIYQKLINIYISEVILSTLCYRADSKIEERWLREVS